MFSGKSLFFISSALLFAGAVAFGFMACGGSSSPVASFDHGVASGDPQADRVVLWTRVTPSGPGGTVSVTAEVASDAEFANPAGTPVTAVASADRDYTVKIDFKGLSAGTSYYYRFRAGGATSPTGRTRTLPGSGADSVKLAVFSCASYASGYFNVYAHAAQRTDIDAVVHLGDYIYEYGTDGLMQVNNTPIVRRLPEDNDVEAVKLEDYRKRYALYRTDPQLQALHAAHPFIAMWDDHEVADNSYRDGSFNHDETEGDFEARKNAALQAYYEWMPIRESGREDRVNAYRSFSFGGLLDLYMLETRFSARDRQLRYQDYVDPKTGSITARMQAKLAADMLAQTMLGEAQLTRLQRAMAGSAATWQVLGQQVLMARTSVPAELLPYFANPGPEVFGIMAELAEIKTKSLAGASLTAQEAARISAVLPYNLDAWDGYPREREIILKTAIQADKNLVVLSGDTHNAWANNLRDSDGKQAGVEFAAPSVTSGGFDAVLSLPEAAAGPFSQAVELLVDDVGYLNSSGRGYVVVSFAPDKAASEWVYVDTVSSAEFGEKTSASRIFEVFPGRDNRMLIPAGR